MKDNINFFILLLIFTSLRFLLRLIEKLSTFKVKLHRCFLLISLKMENKFHIADRSVEEEIEAIHDDEQSNSKSDLELSDEDE